MTIDDFTDYLCQGYSLKVTRFSIDTELFLGGPQSPSNTNNVAWVEVYLRTKWHLDPSSRLATADMAENWGLCPFWGGELGPHLTHCGQGQGLHPLHTKFYLESIQSFGHNTPTLQTGQTDRQTTVR